jgi:hypothetical protein
MKRDEIESGQLRASFVCMQWIIYRQKRYACATAFVTRTRKFLVYVQDACCCLQNSQTKTFINRDILKHSRVTSPLNYVKTDVSEKSFHPIGRIAVGIDENIHRTSPLMKEELFKSCS